MEIAAGPTKPRTVMAGLIGNVLEWYDFAVYGYFALTIGKLFFPHEDPTVSLIAAFSVFAVGFLMRPLGGIVFGHVGDRFGRRTAILTSSAAMAVPTIIVGLLPTYQTIGLWAPALMLVLRMIQGLSVGGEYTSSTVFLAEQAADGRRGRAAAWAVVGAAGGTLLGSATGALVNSMLTPAEIADWGWRVPFLASIVLAVLAFAMRRGLADTAPEGNSVETPLVAAFRQEWRTMLQVAGITVCAAIGFYLIFVYVAVYLREIVHVSSAEALDINSLNMLVVIVLAPLFATLSDRVGRKTILLAAALGVVAFAWPLFALVHSGIGLLIWLGQFGFAVLVAAYLSVMPAVMAEAFPARMRCSAVALAYNVPMAVFGGTAPMVAAYLIDRQHDDFSPAYYLMAAGIVSAVAIASMRETAADPLRD